MQYWKSGSDFEFQILQLTERSHHSWLARTHLLHVWHRCILMGLSIGHWHAHPTTIYTGDFIKTENSLRIEIHATKRIETLYKNRNYSMHWWTNLIHMMNEFVHLTEPWISILIREILSHGPHDMICTSNVCLEKRSKQYVKPWQIWKLDYFLRIKYMPWQTVCWVPILTSCIPASYLWYCFRYKIINAICHIVVTKIHIILQTGKAK